VLWLVLGLVVRFSAGIATYILRNDKKINNNKFPVSYRQGRNLPVS